MSNKSKTEVIAIRVASKIKDDIKGRADRLDMTMTDYILKAVNADIEQDNSKEVKDLKSDIEKVTSQLEEIKAKLQVVETENSQQAIKLEANNELSTAKDQTISNLTEQLDQANKRIDDYSRQLEQGQQLQLATVSSNKELQLKIETLEEAKEVDQGATEEKQGFFSRLFKG